MRSTNFSSKTIFAVVHLPICIAVDCGQATCLSVLDDLENGNMGNTIHSPSPLQMFEDFGSGLICINRLLKGHT